MDLVDLLPEEDPGVLEVQEVVLVALAVQVQVPSAAAVVVAVVVVALVVLVAVVVAVAVVSLVVAAVVAKPVFELVSNRLVASICPIPRYAFSRAPNDAKQTATLFG